MEFETRTTALTVAPKGEPIYAESAFTIRIDDEAGGEFLVVCQSRGAAPDTELRIDPEEWPPLRDAIDRMHMQCRGPVEAAQLDALRDEMRRDEEPLV